MWYSALHSEQMTDCFSAFRSLRCFSFDDYAGPMVVPCPALVSMPTPSDPAASRSFESGPPRSDRESGLLTVVSKLLFSDRFDLPA